MTLLAYRVTSRKVRMHDDEHSTADEMSASLREHPRAPQTLIGDDAELDQRFAETYQELKRLAHRKLAGERAGHTLSTTALVNETYLKLARDDGAATATRGQFFALAARAMRRVLVDYARSRNADRRGGDFQHVSLDPGAFQFDSLDGQQLPADDRIHEILALDDALTRLRALEPRLCEVVELRFFGGYTEAEVAELLGVTPRTIARDWVKARGCLSALLTS